MRKLILVAILIAGSTGCARDSATALRRRSTGSGTDFPLTKAVINNTIHDGPRLE